MEHLSLFELNKTISDVLAKHLEPSYWVVAEIGQMQTNQKGHCYLELVEKEDSQIKAKTRATIWSYTYRNLSTWFHGITGESLKAGMKILFNATVQYHEVYGFSLNIKDIDAQYTLGERAKKRQEIIEQLQQDGVFDMNKELNLPLVPQRLAIISSATAAGYEDFIQQLGSNEYKYDFKVDLFNSVMQGEQAETSIISAMHQVHEKIENYDVLVIIRGGGASLDLDCFDNYELGSHIAQFPIPVVTGIGHERDETIADMVAHTKMKTPTAVAEFILSGCRNFELILLEKFNHLSAKLSSTLQAEQSVLDQLSFNFQRFTQQKLNNHQSKLHTLTQSLKYSQHHVVNANQNALENYLKVLTKQPLEIVKKHSNLIEHLSKELEVLDPENVLKRGYSITTVNGININKLDKISVNSEIITLTEKQEIKSTYKSRKERK